MRSSLARRFVATSILVALTGCAGASSTSERRAHVASLPPTGRVVLQSAHQIGSTIAADPYVLRVAGPELLVMASEQGPVLRRLAAFHVDTMLPAGDGRHLTVIGPGPYPLRGPIGVGTGVRVSEWDVVSGRRLWERSLESHGETPFFGDATWPEIAVGACDHRRCRRWRFDARDGSGGEIDPVPRAERGRIAHAQRLASVEERDAVHALTIGADGAIAFTIPGDGRYLLSMRGEAAPRRFGDGLEGPAMFREDGQELWVGVDALGTEWARLDPASGEELGRWPEPGAPHRLTAMIVAADGTVIARDTRLSVWIAPPGGRPFATPFRVGEPTLAPQLARVGGRRLLLWGELTGTTVYDLDARRVVSRLCGDGRDGAHTCGRALLDPDGQSAWIGAADGGHDRQRVQELRRFDLLTGARTGAVPMTQFDSPPGYTSPLVWSEPGRVVLVASNDCGIGGRPHGCTMISIDVATGARGRVELDAQGAIDAPPDGRFFAIGIGAGVRLFRRDGVPVLSVGARAGDPFALTASGRFRCRGRGCELLRCTVGDESRSVDDPACAHARLPRISIADAFARDGVRAERLRISAPCCLGLGSEDTASRAGAPRTPWRAAFDRRSAARAPPSSATRPHRELDGTQCALARGLV